MRIISLLNIFLITLLLISCSTKKIQISDDFDHGSIGELKEIKPDYFKGTTKHWIKRDSIGDQYYWFYFKADNLEGKTVTFELNDLVGVYRGREHLVYTDYTQPVFSYDNENWLRITDAGYDPTNHTFIFTGTFEQSTAWIAYAHPYPYSRYEKLVSSLRDNEFVSLETIATSAEGREINMISLTDQEVDADKKKVILVMAIQHAGEDAGGFFAEGMIDFILSDSPEAAEVRKNYIYKIVPVMNPDGMYNGVSRYNSRMADLNNIWMDDEKAQEEVTGIKNWLERWHDSGNQLDMFVDIHNHSQFHTYHSFIAIDSTLDSLVNLMNDYWPVRFIHSEFAGSSCAWFHSRNISTGTIELSQSRVNDEQYLTVEDYKNSGEGTVKAISRYFSGINGPPEQGQ